MNGKRKKKYIEFIRLIRRMASRTLNDSQIIFQYKIIPVKQNKF